MPFHETVKLRSALIRWWVKLQASCRMLDETNRAVVVYEHPCEADVQAKHFSRLYKHNDHMSFRETFRAGVCQVALASMGGRNP